MDYVELNPLWQWTLETDDAFELQIPDIATGLCPRGLLPVYRCGTDARTPITGTRRVSKPGNR